MLHSNCRLKSLVVHCSVGVMALALLPGCGGSGQDQGRAAAPPKDSSVAGLVVDGYLARATVYIDADNNGIRDSGEPKAFTDNSGYFSYNPITKKDYCAAGLASDEAQYCLRVERTYTSAVLRVYGGYDLLTQEPFLGQMSRRWDASVDAKNQIVTPLTSLVTDLSPQQKTQLLEKLTITEAQLNTDYLSPGQSEEASKLLNMALKLHKSVTVLSDGITDKYPSLGDEPGLPTDASAALYKNLAQKILEHPGPLDDVLKDSAAINQVMQSVEKEVQAAHEQKEIAMPNDASNTASFGGAITTVELITNLTNVMLNGINTGPQVSIGGVVTITEPTNGQILPNSQTPVVIFQASRAVEALVISQTSRPYPRQEGTTTQISVPTPTEVANFFSDRANVDSRLGQALIGCGNLSAWSNPFSGNSLLGSTFSLGNSDPSTFTGPPSSVLGGCAAPAENSNSLTPGLQLAGKQLRVSDLDLGQAPNQLRDMEFEIYFLEGRNEFHGSLLACAKYVKKGTSDGKLGKGDNPGELITGSWSFMAGTFEQDATAIGVKNILSLVLVFEVAGARYSATMKPVGQETIDGVTYESLMFNHLDRNKVWHSKDGVVPAGKIPTSTKECRARLPSRVGIK